MIQIGRTTSSPEPLGLLTDCHRRIEGALAGLVAAVRGPSVLDTPRRAALDKARVFFSDMAPKHTDDEELSLFPRLRVLGYHPPELDALEGEHQEAHALHEAIDRTLGQWLADGVLASDAHDDLGTQVTRLADLYARHIRVEDEIVFPEARARLSLADQEAVSREMVLRRAIQVDGLKR